MLSDYAAIYIKELADCFLCQPYGILLHSYLDAVFFRIFGKNQKINGTIADLKFFTFAHGTVLTMYFQIFILIIAKRLPIYKVSKTEADGPQSIDTGPVLGAKIFSLLHRPTETVWETYTSPSILSSR